MSPAVRTAINNLSVADTRRRLLVLEPELLHAITQFVALHIEQLGGPALVLFAQVIGFENQLPLDLFDELLVNNSLIGECGRIQNRIQSRADRLGVAAAAQSGARADLQMVRADLVALFEQYGALEAI